MLYVIFNSDGSIKYLRVSESIQQGDHLSKQLFAAIKGIRNTEYVCSVKFELPNGEINELVGDIDTQDIQPETINFATEQYDGYTVRFTEAQTYLAGNLKVNLKLVNLQGVILCTYQVTLKINPTGYIPSETNITEAQYNSLLQAINTKYPIDMDFVKFTPNQGLNGTQKANARNNIGAGTSNFSGSYNDLSNKPQIPTKTSNLQNDGDGASPFATRSYVTSAITGATSFKGTVANTNDLPASGNTQGDMYWVTNENSYYIWNGSIWSAAGGNVDLSNYYTQQESDARYVRPNVINDFTMPQIIDKKVIVHDVLDSAHEQYAEYQEKSIHIYRKNTSNNTIDLEYTLTIPNESGTIATREWASLQIYLGGGRRFALTDTLETLRSYMKYNSQYGFYYPALAFIDDCMYYVYISGTGNTLRFDIQGFDDSYSENVRYTNQYESNPIAKETTLQTCMSSTYDYHFIPERLSIRVISSLSSPDTDSRVPGQVYFRWTNGKFYRFNGNTYDEITIPGSGEVTSVSGKVFTSSESFSGMSSNYDLLSVNTNGMSENPQPGDWVIFEASSSGDSESIMARVFSVNTTNNTYSIGNNVGYGDGVFNISQLTRYDITNNYGTLELKKHLTNQYATQKDWVNIIEGKSIIYYRDGQEGYNFVLFPSEVGTQYDNNRDRVVYSGIDNINKVKVGLPIFYNNTNDEFEIGNISVVFDFSYSVDGKNNLVDFDYDNKHFNTNQFNPTMPSVIVDSNNRIYDEDVWNMLLAHKPIFMNEKVWYCATEDYNGYGELIYSALESEEWHQGDDYDILTLRIAVFTPGTPYWTVRFFNKRLNKRPTNFVYLKTNTEKNSITNIYERWILVCGERVRLLTTYHESKRTKLQRLSGSELWGQRYGNHVTDITLNSRNYNLKQFLETVFPNLINISGITYTANEPTDIMNNGKMFTFNGKQAINTNSVICHIPVSLNLSTDYSIDNGYYYLNTTGETKFLAPLKDTTLIQTVYLKYRLEHGGKKGRISQEVQSYKKNARCMIKFVFNCEEKKHIPNQPYARGWKGVMADNYLEMQICWWVEPSDLTKGHIDILVKPKRFKS